MNAGLNAQSDAPATGWTLVFLAWLLAIAAMLGGWIPESAQPRGEVQVVWFGFLNIPMLSVPAFSILIALLLATHFKGSK